MEPVFKSTDENINVFRDLFQTKRNFGILTTKRLPRLGSMKFFQSFGTILCTVEPEASQVVLTETELNLLIKFHTVLLKDVLATWQSFFVLDSVNSFIIVPTRQDTIQWDIVEEFQRLQPLLAKSEQERFNVVVNTFIFVFSSDAYNNKTIF